MKQIALLAWISPTEGMHINYEWLAISHILGAVREMSEVGASAANPIAIDDPESTMQDAADTHQDIGTIATNQRH
jgi:hypothetical protein